MTSHLWSEGILRVKVPKSLGTNLAKGAARADVGEPERRRHRDPRSGWEMGLFPRKTNHQASEQQADAQGNDDADPTSSGSGRQWFRCRSDNTRRVQEPAS